MNKILKNKGVATLPIVMVLGMMALAIVVSLTTISFNELNSSQGSGESSMALFYAEGGARDALVRIVRDKNYTCSSMDCYSIDFNTSGCTNNTDCAKVSVSGGIGTITDPKIIVSRGIMKLSSRKVEVRVVLDGGTTDASLQNGEITSAVWTEITD